MVSRLSSPACYESEERGEERGERGKGGPGGPGRDREGWRVPGSGGGRLHHRQAHLNTSPVQIQHLNIEHQENYDFGFL